MNRAFANATKTREPMEQLELELAALMGQPPNLRELISSADGVTFWASHEKASRELGYAPRGMEEGLKAVIVNPGVVLAAGFWKQSSSRIFEKSILASAASP